MDPITREEKLLDAVAGGGASGITPITREEQFLAYAAGERDTKPVPITRKEMFLDKVGGKETPTQEKTIVITENGTTEVLPDEGYALGKVTANVAVYDAVDDRVKQMVEGTLTEYIDDSVTTIRPYAFSNCKSLSVVDIPNLTVVPVQAFRAAIALKKVTFPNATEVKNAFDDCINLEEVNFPVAKELADGGGGGFSQCKALKKVNAPLVTALDLRATFTYCSALETLKFPLVTEIESQSVTSTSSAFYMCTSLKRLEFPKLQTFTPSSIFSGCPSFKSLDLGLMTSLSFSHSQFIRAVLSTFRHLILRSDSVVTATSVSSVTNGNFIVFVKSDNVEAYKSDTNWSALYEAGACTFLPLEEYTLDGTTSGEPDWDKIESVTVEGGTTA